MQLMTILEVARHRLIIIEHDPLFDEVEIIILASQF
jgi:hypothetical protein